MASDLEIMNWNAIKVFIEANRKYINEIRKENEELKKRISQLEHKTNDQDNKISVIQGKLYRGGTSRGNNN